MLQVAEKAGAPGQREMEPMARIAFSFIYFTIVTIVAFLVVGCIYTPERFSAIESYQRTGNWFRDTQSAILSGTDTQEGLRHEPFPDINSVPDCVPAVMSAAEREAVLAGLVSDRRNARYSDEALQNGVLSFSVRTQLSPMAVSLRSVSAPSLAALPETRPILRPSSEGGGGFCTENHS